MSFFNSEDGGIADLKGWMGQVVDESTWLDNTANKQFKHKLHTSKDVAGYSYRYKVRIFGRDTEIKNFSDDQLEMAEVLLPVTAGSGHGGSVQTPNIKQGAYVWGFYKDGIDATEPIIVGILPNNSQNSLFGGDPDKNFVPRSGYFGRKRQIPVSTKNIKLEGPSSPAAKEGINPNSAATRDADKNIDGTRKFYIPKTINCEGPSGEVDGLQKIIKQLLIDVKRVQRFTQSFAGAASDLGSNLNNLINEATILVSSLVKSLIAKIRGFVVNWFNKQVTALFDLLPPNLRPNFAAGTEKATNTIECVFNKIVSKLMAILKQLLLQIIDRYVNAPLCAVESFVGSFLSTILGEITSGIANAISGILGPVGNIAGLIFQALEIFIGILNFLSCEEDLDCQVLDEWSFFTGSNLTAQGILGAGRAEKIRSFVDSANNSAPPCNTDQLPCGPPKVDFFGSARGAATGNVVVSAAGYIMGVDLLTGGRYTAPPDVRIFDECGSGGGVVMVPITKELEDGDLTIVDVVIVDPGFGYLNTTNGATGGDGYTFSKPNETIIPPGRPDGTGGTGTGGTGTGTGGTGTGGIPVYPPGKVVPVSAGQIGYFPAGTVVEVFDSNGNVVQEIQGEGQLTPIIIEENGFITTPDAITETFDDVADTYPLLISINDLAVLNEGVNYSENDKIVITPDNGAVVEPIFGDFGNIIDVNIISGGSGFTDIPEITIQSETGINAVLVPVFNFQRIDDLDEVSRPPLDTKVVNVVDCVGKLQFKK
jgi:hypothetical protein